MSSSPSLGLRGGAEKKKKQKKVPRKKSEKLGVEVGVGILEPLRFPSYSYGGRNTIEGL